MSATELGFDPSIKKKKKSKSESISSGSSQTPTTNDTSDLDLFAGLKKKKKKSKDTSALTEDTQTDSVDDITNSFEGLKLKKKKKKSKHATDIDEFDRQLQNAGIPIEEDQVSQANNNNSSSNSSSSSASNNFIPYDKLLDRFFTILKQKNPELAGGQTSKLKIPPPEVQRDGNKKTMFANVQTISSVLQRNPEHLIQYLFAELGTSGSIDGEKRLIIRGRFQSKNIEGVLRRYIQEYVICKTCKSMNTELKRENTNRLHFIVCRACGSTKSVSSIKTGYQAHVGANRKKKY